MASPMENNTKYHNWIKRSLALLYLKEGIAEEINQKAADLHNKIKQDVRRNCPSAVTSTCKPKCTSKSFKKTNHNTRWTNNCASNVCNYWLDELIKIHEHRPCPDVKWVNCDPTLWPSQPWEVAKVFQPIGCTDHRNAEDSDIADLLTFMLNCTFFDNRILPKKSTILKELKEIRNFTMHSATLEVEDADMVTSLDKMIALLEDPTHFGPLPACKTAADKIRELKNKPMKISFSAEDEQTALSQRVASLRGEVASLSSTTNKIRGEIDEIGELNLDEMNQNITTACTDIDKLKKEVNTLKGLAYTCLWKSDIPDGLSTLDPKWTELYLKALREGKEKQRNVRLMIVGHEGVGKTTLARNLMNKSLQGVEPTNGIEVHVRTGLIEVDGTWKESETGSKDAEVSERIARIIEPDKKKVKHAETDNIPKEISPPELIYSRTSYRSYYDSPITEASTLIMENELPQDSEKALDTKKDLSITGQAMVKQLMMVNEKQHNTNPDTTVSVWDFGGHFIFYATHQIFLSSGAIYLLVLDLSKGFDDMIDEGCPITCSGAKRRSVQDFIKFWMHSIHTFASSETGEPPVILVGTHRDKIDEQEMSKEDHAENYFENIRKLFDKTPLLHHIQPQHFFLDNLGPEKNSFTRLKSSIKDTAAEQSSFNKEIPAKWIPLEQALCQIENKPYITFSEVCEMDSKNDIPIADVEVIRLFLIHHHFQGHLVYFNEEELQDYIILKPQWIIDAFKCIITSWRVFNKKPNLRQMWQDFENTAVLKNNLIEEVWQRNDKTDFLADKELLLKFLVRLGIMSRGRAYDEDTGKVEELDYFLVPSLLPMQEDESSMDTALGNATSTQMVIVFKFEDSYISPTIYHCTTAAAVGKWPVAKIKGARQLYENIGIYRPDRHHLGIVRLMDNTLELSVYNLSRKPVSSDIADGFRRFITKAIKQELSRFHCGKETKITTTFRCSCSKLGTEEHVTTEILKGDDRLPCPVTLSHIIHGPVAYREWYVGADTFVQRNRQVLQTKLGDREIGGISKAIGLNWQLLGMDLGISKVELERIQMDHPYSSAVQIRYMLQTWKERAVGEATMQALYDKMKDNPEVSIDWDRIKDVIDILCET